eukprot:31023-Pelagococcus_subviridis.AAC.6
MTLDADVRPNAAVTHSCPPNPVSVHEIHKNMRYAPVAVLLWICGADGVVITSSDIPTRHTAFV